MSGYLYDCDDLLTGKKYRGLPSGRVIQILDGYTDNTVAYNIFKDGQDVHVLGGRFVLTRYSNESGMDSVANLWRSHPDWCKWFCTEWTAICERLRAYG